MEVMNHTHGDMIQTLRFFEARDWNFVWTAIPLMKPIHFTKYEIIYREGDLSEERKIAFITVYFIMKGVILLATKDGKPFRKLIAGTHFGEYTLLRNIAREENAIAVSQCELLIMYKQDYAHLIQQFPREGIELKQEAEEKTSFLREAQNDIEKSENQAIFKNLLSEAPAWH